MSRGSLKPVTKLTFIFCLRAQSERRSDKYNGEQFDSQLAIWRVVSIVAAAESVFNEKKIIVIRNQWQ